MRAFQTVFVGVLLSACVTINVYFPAAAAERAADRIIEDVWGESPDPAAAPELPNSHYESPGLGSGLAMFINVVVPVAQAQGQANIDVNSPAIAATQARMEQRHKQLAPLYASGAVGLANNGLVTVRDLASVPLKQRQSVQRLVADENSDRKALYAEIAQVNNHPEWQADIQATFARRWIANARPGWTIQRADGTWGQR